jgi:hypothetical protein
MKFELKTTSYFYSEEDAIPLRELGFTFKKSDLQTYRNLTLAIQGKPIIYFNTLEELAAFAKQWGEIIVTADGIIEIYDDYRE